MGKNEALRRDAEHVAAAPVLMSPRLHCSDRVGLFDAISDQVRSASGTPRHARQKAHSFRSREMAVAEIDHNVGEIY